MNQERGVSLIIVFFLMMIILSVVLSISTILYTQLKNVRNSGDFVVSYYAAESGVEAFLYDQKQGASATCTSNSTQPCFDNIPLDNGAHYTVTATFSGSSVSSIVSVGTYDNVSREIDKSF